MLLTDKRTTAAEWKAEMEARNKALTEANKKALADKEAAAQALAAAQAAAARTAEEHAKGDFTLKHLNETVETLQVIVCHLRA